MSLLGTLGGIIKSGVTAVVKATPLGGVLGAAYDILKPKAPSGPTVLGNLPTVFTGTPQVSGGGTMGGSSPPRLPALPGTGVAVFGDVRAGGSSTAPTAVGHYTKKGVWTSRRRPRMNPANGRAIGRAARRIKAAEKMFRKVLSITHPGHGGSIRPKFPKRRK